MTEDNPLEFSSSNGNGTDYENRKERRGYTFGESHQHERTEKDEIDLNYLYGTLLRYKWWTLTITFLFTILAFFYAKGLESVYTSSGTILISENGRRPADAGSHIEGILSSSFGVGTGSQLENEIQVLRSRRMAAEIAAEIHSQDTMKNGVRFPILWQEYGVDSTKVSVQGVTGRIRGRMNAERISMETDIIRITYSSLSALEAASLVNTTIDTYRDVSADQRRMNATEALDFLGREQERTENRLRQSEETLREYMKNNKIVEVDGQTNAVINRLAELESQLQDVQVDKVSLNASIDAFESQIEEIRPGLAEQFADNVGSAMQRNQFRLAELETERMMILQRNPTLRNNPEQEPQVERINEQIDLIKQEINQMASKLVMEESDEFIGFLNSEDGGITNRITELRHRLIEARIRESQLNAREKVLQDRLQNENEFFDGLPDNIIELARLKRKNLVNERLYSTISENYTQTSLRKETEFGAGRPLDYGMIPDTPSGPNRWRYVSIGFLMGFMVSIGFIFVRENLNRRIQGVDKLRETGYPLLAVIPDVKNHIEERFEGNDQIIVNGKSVSTEWTSLLDSISPVAESYRRLHNNIVYSKPDNPVKIILITSSKKGEGKTTISINLAVTFAEAGKKVLLIDSDLRRPNIHTFTGEEKEPGLVEYFFKKATFGDVLKPSIAPRVDLMTAGGSISNPSVLLQSAGMRRLLDFAKRRYDFIIVDTPPFGVITDAAPMLKFADTVVVVTKFGTTEIHELKHTLENLNHIHANIAGTVITAYNHKKSVDYYYSGKYSYYDYQTYDEYI